MHPLFQRHYIFKAEYLIQGDCEHLYIKVNPIFYGVITNKKTMSLQLGQMCNGYSIDYQNPISMVLEQ